MKALELKIKLLYSGMPEPSIAYHQDSGLDLFLMKVIEKRKNVFFFDTGVSLEPPDGYYTELFPRSGIYKHDFIMANSVGIIDAGYRGTIFMPVRYLGKGDGKTEAEKLIGERVAQLILKKIEPFEVKIVSQLSDSERGERGFGSSDS